MCDQTVPYTPGTLVWCKLVDRIWWPGEIVDPSTPPDEFKEFISRKKVLTVVYFERDDKYEPVINMDKVFLYSCSKKLEFIEKGYTSYKKQEKSGKSGRINMAHFLEDIINFEKKINGDVNIFDQFEKKEQEQMQHKMLIKGLFTTQKPKKKNGKKVIESRRSLPSSITPKNLGVSLKSQTCLTPKTTKPLPIPIQEKGFSCYLQDGCTFKTTRYENLKRHIAEHKLEMLNQPKPTTTKSPNTKKSSNNSSSSNKALFSSSKKRKNPKSRKSVAKKVKLQDELLKDWDLDDAEEESNENIDNEKDNVDDKNTVDDKHVPQGSKTAGIKNAKMDVQSEVKKITPVTIFDFDEEDDNTDNDYIPDLRKTMSDDNSNLNEGNNENSSKELIDTDNKSEKTEFSVEEHDGNEENQIDSDVNNCVLNSDFESTKDHLSSLNESCDITSSVIKPKTNIITDNVQSNLENVVEIGSIELVNEAMVKSKDSKNKDLYDVDTNNEKEKLYSNVDSTEVQNIDTEMDETENERYVCLLDREPVPDWAKEDGWLDTSHPSHELYKEVRKYITVDRKKQMECFDTDLLEPKPFDIPFQPTIVHEIKEYQRLCNNTKRLKISYSDDVDDINIEDMLSDSEVQKYIEMAKSGVKLTLGMANARIVSIDEGD